MPTRNTRDDSGTTVPSPRSKGTEAVILVRPRCPMHWIPLSR